jgi:type III secretion protein J
MPERNLPVSLERSWRFIFGMLAFAVLAGCSQSELFTQLNEDEANQMIAILYAQGIAATKSVASDKTFKISVPQKDFAQAVDILHNRGYPRPKFVDVGDVFKKSGMVSSPQEDKIRLVYALSQSLSRTISLIDGVVVANVHIVLPESDPFDETTYPSAASVFVKYRPTSRVEDLRSQVKHLVANSVEGLRYENVSLVMVPAAELEPLVKDMPKPANDPQIIAISAGALAVVCFVAYVMLRARKPGAAKAKAS